MSKHKIILDTDPGIDDAMAIFFAFQHPDIDVLGLTTVYGNVPVAMAAQNALRLCDLAEQDIPVTQGVAMPWVGPESTMPILFMVKTDLAISLWKRLNVH